MVALLAFASACTGNGGAAGQNPTAGPTANPPTMTPTLTDAQQVEATVAAVKGQATPTMSVEQRVNATLTAVAPQPTLTPVAGLKLEVNANQDQTETPEPVETDLPTPQFNGKCEDGELVITHEADDNGLKPRTPVGEGQRVDIVEVSWSGKGFGGYDRAIYVVPRLGPVWMVNINPGARTISARGFCGTNEAVAQWAVQAHVGSFQQASRDQKGKQPSANEIGVYLLNFEARSMTVIKAAPRGPDPEVILSRIQVTFHENDKFDEVPMHVVNDQK